MKKILILTLLLNTSILKAQNAENLFVKKMEVSYKNKFNNEIFQIKKIIFDYLVENKKDTLFLNDSKLKIKIIPVLKIKDSIQYATKIEEVLQFLDFDGRLLDYNLQVIFCLDNKVKYEFLIEKVENYSQSVNARNYRVQNPKLFDYDEQKIVQKIMKRSDFQLN